MSAAQHKFQAGGVSHHTRPDMRPPLPLDVLIVDDERPACDRLERLVGQLEGFAVAGCFTSGRDALEQITRRPPAIVLLDIRMPGMTGIEVARHLGTLDDPPAVVFTTAYDQYALEAFDSQAVGYLLKPVRRQRLEAALQHAARLGTQFPEGLTAAPQALAARRHLPVRVRGRLQLVPIDEIIYLLADRKYVTIKHLYGEHLIDESLCRLEEEFPQDMVRVHRSLLAGVAHVEAIERAPDGGYQLAMRHCAGTLRVSRRQVSEVKRRLAAVRKRV